MARKVERGDIVDWQTYTEERDARRDAILPIKQVRRIHLGDSLTFLFENTETTRYQIQEMVRAERIVKEANIQHEIDTYNSLLGGPGELSCSLLIEIEDVEVRRQKLSEWLELPQHLYVKLEDGTQIRAAFDVGQVGEDRLSAVQYLKFDTGGAVPVALGCDLPALSLEAALTTEQRQALQDDLARDI